MRASRFAESLSVHAVAAVVALVLLAPGLRAQTEVDSRWLPWVGCWEVVGEGLGDESQVICVEPVEGDPTAVQLVSEVETAEPERLWSDGSERSIAQAGCEGAQRSYFSDDGHRLYITGTYVCDDGAVQEGRGVLAMVSDDEWVDIRSLSQDGETVVMGQRYVQATPAAIRAAGRVELTSPRTTLARRLAASAPDVETLQEVYRSVGPQATQAWLMEMGQAVDLDADALVALADAGVEPEVIDVAIAVSYPDDFRLSPGQGSQVAQVDKTGQQFANRRWYSPYSSRVRLTYGLWGPVVSAWGYYGVNSWYFNPWFGYSPFGSWGWGGPTWWGGGGWGGGGPILIQRGGGGITDGGGRAVAGRGYRAPGRIGAPATGRSGATRGISRPPRSARPSGGSGAARPATSRGSTSTEARSGSGSTGRRTAKPRRSGGGG